MGRLGNRTNHPVAPLPERFWAKVQKGQDCWLWSGSTNGRYGRIVVDGKNTPAHRVSWTLHNGPVPDDRSVCHHCDNPLCVRPDHLFLGTQSDNMRDCAAKGRNISQTRPSVLARGDAHGMRLHPERRATGEKHGSKTHPECVARGSRQGSSRLTEAQVADARAMHREGRGSVSQIAELFGVSRRTMCDILRRTSWRHV